MSGPGGDSQWPDYPWVVKGSEPRDFLGNEFLLWLWWRWDSQSDTIALPDDQFAGATFFTFKAWHQACPLNAV